MNELRIFLISSIGVSVLAFLFAVFLYGWVKKQPSTNDRINEIGSYIKKGAEVFLNREYKVMARFAGITGLLILILLPSPIWKGDFVPNIMMLVSYLCGTLFSALAGKIGIAVSTIANTRTAVAATKGIKPSFLCGFRGGAVMGMAVVGSSLLGVSLVFWITGNATALLGFSFGASSLALFAKAGG